MAARVKVGDTVHLNDHGLWSIYGTNIGLRHVTTKKMKITFVSEESITSPEETYDVYVDDPEFNQFMLTDIDFNLA